MDKFQNKYRISTARMQSWDYRCAGAYFITICTQNREHYFGQIKNGKMESTQIGNVADKLWYEIPNHFKNTELGAFIVMPDHIHGILILNTYCDNINQQPNTSIEHQRIQPNGKNSVSSIIGAYKSAVSKHVHQMGYEFHWQARFYDHIIRNESAYKRITNYIENNPANW